MPPDAVHLALTQEETRHGPRHAEGQPASTPTASCRRVGRKAPDFKLTAGDLKDVSLADYKGKKKILNIVPSLDTPICATSTRKFNEDAGKLPNTVVLVVSADLPFAAKRFCATEGLAERGRRSRLMRAELRQGLRRRHLDGPLAGVTARAVVVLDENDKVVHTPARARDRQEPDYEAALAAVK